ncbi:hypothetical protein B0H14DRAFT_3037223, partial [Mycena olivaceomarginata]
HLHFLSGVFLSVDIFFCHLAATAGGWLGRRSVWGGGLFFRFILRSWLCFLYFSFLVLEYLLGLFFLPSPYISFLSPCGWRFR